MNSWVNEQNQTTEILVLWSLVVAETIRDSVLIGQGTLHHPLLIFSFKDITQDTLDQTVNWDMPV